MSKLASGWLQISTALILGAMINVQGQQSQTDLPPADAMATMVEVAEPPPPSLNGARVIEQFVKAEKLVRDSMNQHMFKRDVLLQTIGPDGEPNGDYIRRSEFIFDDRGNRIERVVYHPAPSLQRMKITKEDIQDLAGAQLLGIDVTEQSKYRLIFVGAETLVNRQTFAIDVTPHVKPNPHKMKNRFFVGRIWIDAKTFQIVKVRGKVEPQGKQRFPIFETWRDTPQGELLFPTRTHADDILHFPQFDVHYSVQVRYYDYKLFAGKVTIKDVEDGSEGSESLNAPDVSPRFSKRAATACKTKKSAPPVSLYVWPPDSKVRVYFMRGMFTREQRQTLLAAMKDWNQGVQQVGAGVSFTDGGETERRVSCSKCLTIARKHPKVKTKFYATFYPVHYEQNGWLNSAWIEFDQATVDPTALQGYMAHELGHSLGLDNCPSCGNKKSIMNSFPAINRHNGLLSPTQCDLEVVRRVYNEHRKVAASSTQTIAVAVGR
ncbi:MAG TPA: hypothetical protein VJV03_04830 [Pyrinomonadaceae bacterium]|nr:hypothetical protein [Pyrinomonadaceae bacterium]